MQHQKDEFQEVEKWQLTKNAREKTYEKIEKAEKGIRAFYKRKTAEEEEKAWKDMEKCSSSFYRYAKSKEG